MNGERAAASNASAFIAVPINNAPTLGPTISLVVVSEAKGKITWNVVAPNGLQISTLAIDGTLISNVAGPFTATSGVNFSGPLGSLTAGVHTYTITATDMFANVSTVSDSFTVSPISDVGPTISQIAVSEVTGKISWVVVDPNGGISSTLAVDGTSMPSVSRQIVSGSEVDFSAPLGPLAAGDHTYLITAADIAGSTATSTDTFTTATDIPGPTISQIVVSEARARISWNAVDPTGLAVFTLAIDGQPVTNIAGPFTAASGVNYSAPLDSLAAGVHTYTISAMDGSRILATTSNTFTLAATTTFDPMISQVVISRAKGRISWNVFDPNGVRSSTLQIDLAPVANVAGPFTATSGVNFSASLASLAPGSHTYRITATDRLGNQSVLVADFQLAAAASAAQAAVFSGIGGSAPDSSAKVAWTLDLGGLADSLSSSS